MVIYHLHCVHVHVYVHLNTSAASFTEFDFQAKYHMGRISAKLYTPLFWDNLLTLIDSYKIEPCGKLDVTGAV